MKKAVENPFLKSEQVIGFVDKFIEQLKQVTVKEYSSPLLALGMALLVKCLRTYKAIYLVCKADFSDEAQVLLRVLVESVITLQNIFSKDPEERAYKYFAYQTIVDEKISDAWKRNRHIKGPSFQADKIIQEQVQDLRKTYGNDTYEGMRKKLWKGILPGPIENAFKAVGHSVAYDTVYRDASRNVHSDDALDYFSLLKPKGYFLHKTNSKGIPETLAIGGLFLLAALEVPSKAFKISTRKEIKKWRSHFSEFESLFKKNTNRK